MTNKLSGLCCVFLLLLAPVSAVVAGSCYCVATQTDVATLIPIPCCETAALDCCYERPGERTRVGEVLIATPTQLRLPALALAAQLSPLPPAGKVVSLRGSAPRSERPPGGSCPELSFRQSWLI